MTDLQARRGDTESYDLALLDATGQPLNLGVITDIWFTIKRSPASTDADAIVQKTIGDGLEVTDELGGLATVTLDAADLVGLVGDTEVVLRWDVQIKDTDDRVTTVDDGGFTVVLDVTHAIA